jgi:hypothetical protein
MKGQIRMFETVGVLLIFFFLLALGASWYTRYAAKAAEKEQLRIEELKRASTADNAFYLPELDCNFVRVQTPNCFDKLKAKAFAELVPENPDLQDLYFASFGYANVRVWQVWPESPFNQTLYKNELTDYSKLTPSRSPVLLYDPTEGATGTYSFGVIEVQTYVE